MEWANGWWSSPVLDQVIPWVTHLGSHVAVIIFLILCLIFMKKRKTLLYLLLLYGIQSGVVYGLKFLIQRKRPFVFLETLSKLSQGPGEVLDPSFPSAHTLYAFMMATLLTNWFPRYRIIFFLLCGIRRMDPDLLRGPLPYRCRCRWSSGLRDYQTFPPSGQSNFR